MIRIEWKTLGLSATLVKVVSGRKQNKKQEPCSGWNRAPAFIKVSLTRWEGKEVLLADRYPFNADAFGGFNPDEVYTWLP